MRSRRNPPPPGAFANRRRPPQPPARSSYTPSYSSSTATKSPFSGMIWPLVIGGGAVAMFALWQAKSAVVDIHGAPGSEEGKVAVAIALPIAIIAVAVIILISIGRR